MSNRKYTMEETDVAKGDDVDGEFDILDPDGEVIATVRSPEEAEALLSHLNRE